MCLCLVRILARNFLLCLFRFRDGDGLSAQTTPSVVSAEMCETVFEFLSQKRIFVRSDSHAFWPPKHIYV